MGSGGHSEDWSAMACKQVKSTLSAKGKALVTLEEGEGLGLSETLLAAVFCGHSTPRGEGREGEGRGGEGAQGVLTI